MARAVVRQTYELGRGTVADVLNEQRRYLEIERAYTDATRWLTATRDAIESCECTTGCPSCVQSPKCGNGNEPLDKAGAGRRPRAGRDEQDDDPGELEEPPLHLVP